MLRASSERSRRNALATLELVEEAEVVFEEPADVGDLVLTHGEPFDAEAEGPAGVLLAVDADGVEDVGVDGASPAHLDPVLRRTTYRTTLIPLADQTYAQK